MRSKVSSPQCDCVPHHDRDGDSTQRGEVIGSTARRRAFASSDRLLAFGLPRGYFVAQLSAVEVSQLYLTRDRRRSAVLHPLGVPRPSSHRSWIYCSECERHTSYAGFGAGILDTAAAEPVANPGWPRPISSTR